MRLKIALVAMAIVFGSSVARADLEIYKDYTLSDAVWSVSTIKVKPHMIDAYLEGLKSTWVSSNATMKSLGQVEDYRIYVSDLPESGDFNVLLVVKFKNDEMLAPNKARYDAYMAKFGEAQAKAGTDKAKQAYPALRDITGEYRLREVTIK